MGHDGKTDDEQSADSRTTGRQYRSDHHDCPFASARPARSASAPSPAALCAPERASAQGGSTREYEATTAGIPVGKDTRTVEVGDDSFSATAEGGTAGLLKAFSGGTGSGASQGRVVNGALVAEVLVRQPPPPPKKSRDDPDGARQWRHQGIHHRAGAPGRYRTPAGDRRAEDERVRPDDRLAAARARQRRTGEPGCLPHPSPACSTAACATTSSSISSGSRTSRPRAAITARRGLRALFRAGLGLHPRTDP